jgi:zinc transport system ATP-binding protein
MLESAPAISLNQLSIRFGEFQALEDISLEIAAGAFVAIVGPNGAGKSTLLKAILGLEAGYLREGNAHQSGHVVVMGKPANQQSADWVGYVPQVKAFDRSFPALALEVVVSGLRRAWPFRITPLEKNTALQALKQVGGSHLAERKVGRLSGGELQRVYLARSLVRRPKLLLLDEPATGVDAVGEADLYRHLETYQQQTQATILMITHDWEAAHHHASQVLLLNRSLISFGAPAIALSAECLRRAFGHVGHTHKMHLAH